MAGKLKVSYSHYTKLEGGFVKPSFDVIERMYQTFDDVDTNKLFKKKPVPSDTRTGCEIFRVTK